MQQKKSISSPKVGMNRDTHYSQLQNSEYTFCLNCNTENEAGEGLNINNEPSNYLTVVLPPSYKVVGYRKHPRLPKVFFFLTNPITGYSSFGYVDVIYPPDSIFQQDTNVECEGCDYYNTLPTPLEDTVQTPYAEYTELLNDLCNKDFNFSIDHPIKHIEIKDDKLGTFIYFVDGYNPDRWIDADNIEFYQYTGEIICGEDQTIPVCVNVEKMLQQPIYSIPTITPEVLQIGGNLRMGTYEYILAYSDLAGNEISEFYSITQPVRVFDENNRVLAQTELDSFTNFGVKLKVDNLDTKFKYYKVVVVERVAVNQAESYYELGIYPTTNDTIVHTSTQTGTENLGGVAKRINYTTLIARKPRYEHSGGIEIVDNTLFKWDLEGKKIPNLQPIANLIGGFVKWNSSVAKEKLYKDAIASANFLGYMREEVEPFGLRLFTKDGMEYPILPLVARPPKPEEVQTIASTDKNLQSVLANGTSCTSSDRTKKWQLYNTATVDGLCTDFTANGQEVAVEEVSTCLVNDVAEYEDGNIQVSAQQGITDLKEFVNSNLEEVADPDSDKYIPEIASYLIASYPDAECTPAFDSECSEPTLDGGYVQIQQVTNEVYTTSYNEDEATYPTNVPPAACLAYQQNADGTPVPDTEFQTAYALTTVYKRQGIFQNESCVNAADIPNNNNPQQGSASNFNNYYGALLQADLTQTDYTTAATNTYFLSNLHKGSLWFKVNKNNRSKLLFEISPNSQCIVEDDIPSISNLRYTFYSECGEGIPMGGAIFNSSAGVKEVVDVQTFPDTFYVAVDAPIVATTNAKYRTAPPCGCYTVLTRDLQVTGNSVSFDSIIFQKINTYSATCTYIVPEINECAAVPYQYGDFSYWESTETYPDNAEMYNSSNLTIENIDLVSLSEPQKQAFRDYYTNGSESSIYVLNEETTDLRCKPIRHYKFPSNIVSPFMGTASNAPFAEALIFPMGISLDVAVVNAFLDIAVKNNLLSQKQRDNIAGFEVMKGDNAIQKSIVANTVGFDMYKYDEKGEEVLYPNYPLNDLGTDILQIQNGAGIPHPTLGLSNYNFSLLSPDLSLNKLTLPSELIVSGYQIGKSRGYFAPVEDHPRYVLLTRNAKNVATTLAIAEVALEAAITLADLTVKSGIGQLWVTAGVSGGTNAPGAAASVIALIVYGAAQLLNGVVKVGQYRLQWLQTMENLGQPRNYASYYVCEGHHNRFIKNELSSETVRGISASKYLQPGRIAFRDEKSGDPIKINNFNREQSTFVSVGETYPIVYPASYSNYDNNTLSLSNGSRTIISENGGKEREEIVRNTGVPYITLRNYIPNQYGTIDSIKWLTTSYKTLLSRDNSCEVIYGGTVFLCRDYQKRKHPLFTTNAFGGADMQPFSYTNYPNIGDTTRFRVDFRTGGEADGIGDFLFPDLNSDFFMDNENSSAFYMKESSKFYLFYYGFASYLVESEINTNFRYGRRDPRDQYYPDIQGDMVEYTQEKYISIKEPNTYFYNSVYSRPVTQTAYTLQPATYEKEIYDKVNNALNGIIYSMPDNSQNDLTDPWLIFKPLNFYEFGKKYGRIISLEALESETLLVRFENGELLLNAVDTLSPNSAISIELGTGGIFSKRFLEARKTELGFAGTQNTDYLSTPYGHVSVDAKRGQVFLRNGQENTPISDYIGNRPSNIKTWFRQQLPFKILRQYPTVDIDNKYKGIGITMGYDNKTDRILITKKDYIVKEDPCLSYDEELGFVINETLCGEEPTLECPVGYTYNAETGQCGKQILTEACPDGYTYNEATGKCETEGSSTLLCAVGWTYDEVLQLCSLEEETAIPLECGEGCTIIMQLDGNAMCVCPAEAIDSFCTECDVTGGIMGCPDGYTYDEGTDTCKKIVQPCPFGEGMTFGGNFTTPDVRLLNTELTMPNLEGISSFAEVRVIKRQNDGKILVGGSFTTADGQPAKGLIRLNLDGSLDNTFDVGDGFFRPLPQVAIIEDIDVYADGKIIVVGGFDTFAGQPRKGIARLTSTGQIDYSFDPGTGFSQGGTGGIPSAVKIAEGNKILVGHEAFTTYNGVPTKGLIKLLNDGTPDPTFLGGDRLNYTGVPADVTARVFSIDVDANGKYVVAGRFLTYNGTTSRRIVRLNTDGTINLSFGDGFDFDATQSSVIKVQMQGNKILAAGTGLSFYKGTAVSVLVRINANGTLDTSFNNYKIVGGQGVLDFDISNVEQILIGGVFNSYDTSTADNAALLDEDGFVINTTLPVFSTLNRVTAVLNAPECNLCPDEDCNLAYNELGQLVCTCPSVLLDVQCLCTDEQPPIIVDRLTPVSYDNTDYFEEASWTIGFRPQSGWLSYYSFKPDYYINFEESFITGLNYATEDSGSMWTHPMRLNSFQVFYGKLQPFIVESVVINENVNKILNSISVLSETKRWKDFDFSQWNTMGFGEGIIYTNNSNSHLLELEQTRTLADRKNYPQTTATSQKIPYTSYNERHTFNYFFNRVKNFINNIPIFRHDNVNVDKELNPQAVSFKGKSLLERLKFNQGIVRLVNNKESRLSVLLKGIITGEAVDE